MNQRLSKNTRDKNWAILIALITFIVLIFFVTVSRLKGNVEQRLEGEAVLETKINQYIEKSD